MKKLMLTTAMLALAACAPEPIVDADVPYTGKYDAPAVEAPAPTTAFEPCPMNSGKSTKVVKAGHTQPLCYEDAAEPRTPGAVFEDVIDVIEDKFEDKKPKDKKPKDKKPKDKKPKGEDNPGNHKPVGKAGENPNGKGGWGSGSKGRSS